LTEFIELPKVDSAVASDVVLVDSVSRGLRCEEREESAAFVVSLMQSEATWLWAEEIGADGRRDRRQALRRVPGARQLGDDFGIKGAHESLPGSRRPPTRRCCGRRWQPSSGSSPSIGRWTPRRTPWRRGG